LEKGKKIMQKRKSFNEKTSIRHPKGGCSSCGIICTQRKIKNLGKKWNYKRSKKVKIMEMKMMF
jgi:hypothetical protein